MKYILNFLVLFYMLHAYIEAAPNVFDDLFSPGERPKEQNQEPDAKKQAYQRYIFEVRAFGDDEVRDYLESWTSGSISLGEVSKVLSRLLDDLFGKSRSNSTSFQHFLNIINRSLYIPHTLNNLAKVLRYLIDEGKEVREEDCDLTTNTAFNAGQ